METNKDMPLPIEIFLSHADEDKSTARKIADEMMKHGVSVFVAHDDIDPGANWKSVLVDKISKCDIFVVLLTENFHKAEFTDHEVGMAYYLKKRIIPIQFDATPTYGFMSDSQAKQISIELNDSEIKNLVDITIAYSDEGKRYLDQLIDQLLTAGGYGEANAYAKLIFQHTKFLPEQVNKLAEVWLTNGQVRGATLGDCPKCLSVIRKNWSVVDDNYKKQLQTWIH